MITTTGGFPYTPPPKHLCFTANTEGSTIKLDVYGGSPNPVSLEISTDGISWSNYTIGNTITLYNIGDKVYFRNISAIDTGFNSLKNIYKFYMSGSIAGSGDIGYLLNKNSTNTMSDHCFTYLFYGCTSLTSSPVFPAINIGPGCYCCMFQGCTNLTTGPSILPATTLDSECYSHMFSDCSSLTTAPTLPATIMANSCYSGMFQGCTGLTTPPALPSTTLAGGCYNFMFANSGLTTATTLPATTVYNSSYFGMFQNTSITTPPALPATTLGSYSYSQMFYGCSNLTSLPELPVTTLDSECYSHMFQNCSKIKLSTTQTGEYQTPYRIPTSGTGTIGSKSLQYMFSNTGGTFTGEPNINTTYYTSNTIVPSS